MGSSSIGKFFATPENKEIVCQFLLDVHGFASKLGVPGASPSKMNIVSLCRRYEKDLKDRGLVCTGMNLWRFICWYSGYLIDDYRRVNVPAKSDNWLKLSCALAAHIFSLLKAQLQNENLILDDGLKQKFLQTFKAHRSQKDGGVMLGDKLYELVQKYVEDTPSSQNKATS